MNYYESVVMDYLRADRSVFINTECCIQLNEGNPDTSGPHWYCDAVAVDMRRREVLLCEVSYSAGLAGLDKRLAGWFENWAAVGAALVRDSGVPADWRMRPWLFVPEHLVPLLLKRLGRIVGVPAEAIPMWFVPRVTTLEMVQPWKYPSWNRQGEAQKPAIVPEYMH